ncbi:hypothetical protein HGQ17_08600 [Nesterenkonia sp. MY13]|uniref:Asparagine synthetase domain-containing protein n=1 Tax=Nesterenkonia sedimenti TaxID=1463632 RepID=A0A7X8TJR4_9MICC|nr:asparagine synthase-related protein [Nesterenkonia sedimenti]NLS10056.1 hypothetical protein [Nesterenkonia sedimenti]
MSTPVCGVLGQLTPASQQQAEDMVTAAQQEGVELQAAGHNETGIFYTAAGTSAAGVASVLWNAAGELPAALAPTKNPATDWTAAAREADACGIHQRSDGSWILHGSVSGTQVLYVYEAPGGVVLFSTRLRWLTRAAEQLSPDWQSWTEIIAFGAPLSGRTTFAGIHRLKPMEYLETTGEGRVNRGAAHWAWEDYTPQPVSDLQDITEATIGHMSAQMRPYIAEAGTANPMLSGGRDSRMLTALALNESAETTEVTAWTTSSDSGTALEELIAAQVAETLEVDHRIITGRYSQFAQDFTEYADAVDYQASFHFWLMPVVRRLKETPGPIFDGIGGGVLLGGGFADPPNAHRLSRQDLVAARIGSRARYLTEAQKVLAETAAAGVSSRSSAAAEPVAQQYLDHPNGHTLTSYLLRTVPGIAPAPAKVLGRAQPTLMPMVSDPVAQLALSLPHEVKADGAWYPYLLKAADPRLEGMETADDLMGRRHHKRRIASVEAAAYLGGLIQNGPASGLLAPQLREADLSAPGGLMTWQRMLNSQRPQHLIRGLAMLTLWLQEHQGQLKDSDPVKGVQNA